MLRPLWAGLGEAVDEMGATARLSRFQIQARWPELVGPRLAQHSQPQRLQGTNLWIVTEGPVWSQEITLRQDVIIQAIRRRFPKLRVGGLRCKVGTVRREWQEAPPSTPQVDLAAVELPPSVVARCQQLAEEVQDPKLRESLLRAMLQKEKRDFWLRQQGAVACRQCGALQELRCCRGCRQEIRRQRRQKIFQFLGRQPWATFQECLTAVDGVKQGEFHTARRQLLSLLRLQFYAMRENLPKGSALPVGLRQVLVEICMLATATPWDQLQERHVRYALGKTWAQAYLQDFAPGPYDPKKKP